MQASTFAARTPFEIGDKLLIRERGWQTITDIQCVHSIKNHTVIFYIHTEDDATGHEHIYPDHQLDTSQLLIKMINNNEVEARREEWEHKPEKIPVYDKGTGVIIYNQNTKKVLVGNRSDGQGWSFAGGKIEEGETSAECAVRELFEEFGIQMLPHCALRYQGTVLSRAMISRKFSNVFSDIYFYMFGENPEVTLSKEEFTEYRWVDLDEFMQLDHIFIPTLVAANEVLYDFWKFEKRGNPR